MKRLTWRDCPTPEKRKAEGCRLIDTSKIRGEARRICHLQHDAANYDTVLSALVHREFMREIEPILKAKASIYWFSMPRITIYADGRIEREYDLSEQKKAVLAQADELIEWIASRYSEGSQ